MFIHAIPVIQGNFYRAQVAASFEHAFETIANRNRTRFARAILSSNMEWHEIACVKGPFETS